MSSNSIEILKPGPTTVPQRTPSGEATPSGVEDGDKKYRVKKVPMGQSYNTGVNKFGYHFSKDDLIDFFASRNYRIAIISDEKTDDPWSDRYLRFLASKE